ncbi:hypothetical protein [Streptomyces mayteni]
MSPIQPDTLRRLARDLEIDACVVRLLAHLVPGTTTAPMPWDRPGRYPVLETEIQADVLLHQALLSNEQSRVREAWARRLQYREIGIPLHHTLAVLHREAALASSGDTEQAAELLTRASALWTLLLGTASFWPQYHHQDLAGELCPAICRELFELHRTRGAAALARGEHGTARTHLTALDACRQGEPAVRELLSPMSLWQDSEAPSARIRSGDVFHGLAHPRGRSHWAEISRMAGDVLDDWYHEAINAAGQKLTDPAGVARQPAGITKDFDAGVRALEPLAGLATPALRLLIAGLDWCNEWLLCIYHLSEPQPVRQRKMRQTLDRASTFAEPLARIATKGNGTRGENQALSKYHLFRGFVADAPLTAVRSYTEALEWNPHNDNATTLRDQANAALHREKFDYVLGSALSAVKDGDTTRARAGISTLQGLAATDEDRAWVYFLRATSTLAEVASSPGRTDDGHRDAREQLDLALAYAPPGNLHDQIRTLIDLLSVLPPGARLTLDRSNR